MISLPKNYNATKICLDDLNITEIPPEVFLYKNLRKLSLRNNRIKKIPKQIVKLKLLENLDVSNNELTSLYAKIFELKNLKILILNDNNLKSIPEQINKLERLRILGVANNKLLELNDSFSPPSLTELNLSGNKFSSMPVPLVRQKKLKKLWLRKYDFIPPAVSHLKTSLPYLEKIYSDSPVKQDSLEREKVIKPKTRNEQKKVKKNMRDIMSKVFISYSHKDAKWLERLKVHLRVLEFENSNFETWDDEKIKAGQNWKTEIASALEQCSAAILMISTDFLASDFIRNEELQPLLRKAETDGTLILPLILSPSRFLKTKKLSEFQAINWKKR